MSRFVSTSSYLANKGILKYFFAPIHWRTIGIGLVAISLILFGNPTKPNVILISIDTLRADFFTPEYMPLTYAWARENGDIYTRIYANATWTSPSHLTMLIGLMPSQHGLEVPKQHVRDNLPLLQQRLRERGYYTTAWVNGGYVSKEFGFNKGFDLFVEDREHTITWPFEKFILWIQRRAESPFFAWLHTFEVHDYLLETDYWKEEAQRNAPDGVLHKIYSDRVQSFDKVLADFLDKLQDAAPKDAPLYIIITSDHGEALGEYYDRFRLFGHGLKPYENQIRVPLVISSRHPEVFDRLGDLASMHEFILRLSDGEEPLYPIRSEVKSELMHRQTKQRWTVTTTSEVTQGTEQTAPSKELTEQLKALGYIK